MSFLINLYESFLYWYISPAGKPERARSYTGVTGSLWYNHFCVIHLSGKIRVSPLRILGFHFCLLCGVWWEWCCMRFLFSVLHGEQCTCLKWMPQWKVLWGRTSCYAKKLRAVLIYIMDSIFRWACVPIAWLHYARGQQFQHYIVNIETLDDQKRWDFRLWNFHLF